VLNSGESPVFVKCEDVTLLQCYLCLCCWCVSIFVIHQLL